ncbi:mannose-6-phosphate isomerase [Streptomyces carpaticus]|uniref:SIS domain-containing protein n=1 Tax=Streptomyces carpaticus TaxID=285558 RepID=UPI0021FDA80F|nr:mannose-6-phosphate isomerase [Streptomyces carpaticus]
MIDETLLEDPARLARADPRGLLRGVAAAGAQVRTAARAATEAGIDDLRPEGRPGTVLIAGTGPEVPLAADLLTALAGGTVPVTVLEATGPLAAPGALQWPLPRWAGPMDLLLLTSAEGSEAGLSLLVDAAYRRGCSIVSVSPAGSPLAEATAYRRNLAVALTRPAHLEPAGHPPPASGRQYPQAPGPYWALLTPLLLLGERLGLYGDGGAAAQPAVAALADRLDALAERCGPAAGTGGTSGPDAGGGNPAKILATDCGAALPLLWSEGPLAGAAARHAAATLTALAGLPALSAPLPGALTAHGALLAGASRTAEDDFFRDRVEEPEVPRPRVLLLRGATAAGAVTAARDLALEHNVPLGELAPAEDAEGPLAALADLLVPLDFAAVYLALAQAPDS